jgi:broad specificity phosphatase PhoE
MGTLTLVRHGQASYAGPPGDGLSSTGREQSRRLADYWIRAGTRFDEVYAGPRPRHRATAAVVGARFAEAGRPWPEPVETPDFDEHHVDRLLKEGNGLLRERPELRPLHDPAEAALPEAERERRFWGAFRLLLQMWVQGAPETRAVESWDVFCGRVRRGIDRIRSTGGRGRRVVVFTSAGTISAALRGALDCPDATAAALGWQVRNASVTQFLFSGERFTLESFNGVPHLDDPALWTHR